MKKANGDCLRGGGEQQGEGWLLAMEDQDWDQGNTAPRDDQGQAQQKAHVLQKTSAEYKSLF